MSFTDARSSRAPAHLHDKLLPCLLEGIINAPSGVCACALELCVCPYVCVRVDTW